MLRFLIRTLGVRPRVRVARTYNVPRDLSIGSRRINSRRGTGNSRSIDMLKKEEENRQPRQINGSLVDPVDHLIDRNPSFGIRSPRRLIRISHRLDAIFKGRPVHASLNDPRIRLEDFS